MRMTPLVERLRRAVFESPSDLSVRRVFADALIEAGDPYGEFIALQFDGSARARKRAQKLLDRYEGVFLGELTPMVPLHGARWSHGFVNECVVTVLDAPVPESFATVETMWFRPGALAPRVLEAPQLRLLREVHIVQSGSAPDATLATLRGSLETSQGRKLKVHFSSWPEWAGSQPFVG
jgi:uncharacterized protein (TIGR02996 family)